VTKKFLYAILIYSAAGMMMLASCDADRDNIYDPDGKYSNAVSTTFYAHSLYNSSQGIAEALIIAPELKQSGYTSQNGNLTWNHFPISNITLFVEKEGYFSDTLQINLSMDKNSVDIALNRKPVIEKISFYSLNENGNVKIAFDATVKDDDGRKDIEKLYLFNTEGNLRKNIPWKSNDDYFLSFSWNDIPDISTPESIPGKLFRLCVKQTNGDSLMSETVSIARIVTGNLQLLRPVSDTEESGSIFFKWQKPAIDYPVQYYISVYRLFGQLEKIGEAGPIVYDKTEFELSDQAIISKLNNGTYLWNLRVTDEYGNSLISEFKMFKYFK
jgi:hypothetical protein